jgi:hypothetical protein
MGNLMAKKSCVFDEISNILKTQLTFSNNSVTMMMMMHPQNCLGDRIYLGFDALKAMIMESSIALYITPCSLLKIN